ncbi:type II toxin-antitoxin system HipA family toxin [Gemmatimonas sp.]|uniref:type II toxin-antitoxin system HipA family toxin n=1 Tax=Gemmatimonas sp. TaxID=1962908 RepID=UPI0037BF5D37
MSAPTAYVYIDMDRAPRLVGRLYVTAHRGGETATFQYDDAWVASADSFALEPALSVSRAPHYAGEDRRMFGALGDSAPDRWGQTLLRRAERREAKAENRAPRALREVDFLLGVTDSVRQGALRLALTEGGPFVAPERPAGVPPLVELPALLAASDRYLSDQETAEDLRLLLAPGSSLGGARPKASVRDTNGTLLIAKFPKREEDDYRVVVWEAVALQLARDAGIRTTESRLDRVADNDVLLVTRFDRQVTDQGVRRIPYLSAMSMLGAVDGERRSYVEIADALRAHGAAASQDLAELWRRIVFSVLISNTDDHLRNHGFLYTGATGWRLSPVFDVNPVPTDIKDRMLSTAIGVDGDPTASLDIALEVAPQFGLKAVDAKRIVAEVGAATARWQTAASRFGIAASEIERLRSAFEHEESRAAAR